MTEDCLFESTGPAPDGVRHVGAGAVRRVWEDLFTATEQARFDWEDVRAGGDRAAEKLSYVKG